jgi:hypothetical protein
MRTGPSPRCASARRSDMVPERMVRRLLIR